MDQIQQPAERPIVVRVDGVSKSYRLGEQTVSALIDVSMQVEAGEFLAIAGPSGSGKSTLLNLIGCIDNPDSGRIFIDNIEVTGRNSDQLSSIRSQTIGFIFQTFNLLPVLSAWENVEYPLLFRKDISKSERERRVKHYLGVVGLDTFAKHRPNQLSGGQRQRVAIARALAGHPKIVLADEPTANLDSKTGHSVLALMKELNQSEGTTFIFSTHDPKVMEIANRIVRVKDGSLNEEDVGVQEIRRLYKSFFVT